MASCCFSSTSRRKVCPENGQDYSPVSQSTVLQHIKKPWKSKLTDQDYFFCSDPECDVVYFGQDNTVINKSELRTMVGIKEAENKNALICYCFDITFSDVAENPVLKQFVIQKTKNSSCSCESQNPSGKCCLKDFT